MGAGLGFSTTLSTLYIMEVATPQMRSGLAVVPAVAGTLGVLYCQLLGALLEWQSLSLVLAGHNAPFFIMLLFIPETPVYLLGKEQVRLRSSLQYKVLLDNMIHDVSYDNTIHCDGIVLVSGVLAFNF